MFSLVFAGPEEKPTPHLVHDVVETKLEHYGVGVVVPGYRLVAAGPDRHTRHGP